MRKVTIRSCVGLANGSERRAMITEHENTIVRILVKGLQQPIHASSLNQVEIYFSIVRRTVLDPNDSLDLADVEARLLAFQDYYEHVATPFEWKFSRIDLDRIDRCQQLTAA